MFATGLVPMPEPEGRRTGEEATMLGTSATRTGVFAAMLLGTLLLIVLAPSGAQATWKSAAASIVDPKGTGYVPLLNVRVANHAVNDAATVTSVELSDDGVAWYSLPYTGEARDWVLTGSSGLKTLRVRFIAADGAVSPVVQAAITVDPAGPATAALRCVRAAAGRRASFGYVVCDAQSPRVRARLVVCGSGVRRSYALGCVCTGEHVARVCTGLPAGSYRWSVEATDLAGWAQEKQVARTLVVK